MEWADSADFANGAEHHSGMGPLQEPADRESQGDRQVDHGVVLEEQRADDRQGAQDGNVELGQACDGHADEAGSYQGAEADAEDGQGKAGRHLVRHQGQHQHGEDQRQCGTRQGRRADAEDGAAGGHGDAEADHGADQHHALDSEVKDAGALHHQLADGGEQHRGGGDRR